MNSTRHAVVDRSRCFSYGVCVATLPDMFEFDDDGKSSPVNTEAASLEQLIVVVDDCPVGAISIQDFNGLTIYP
ncbi:MAG: ferredoxin [Acidimicrobiia bacterium]